MSDEDELWHLKERRRANLSLARTGVPSGKAELQANEPDAGCEPLRADQCGRHFF